MRPAALIGFVFVVFLWPYGAWGAFPQGDTLKGRPENNSGTVPIFPQGKWDCPPPKPGSCLSAAPKEAPGGRAQKKAGRAEPKLNGTVFSSPGVRTGYAGHYACRTFTGINRRLCVAISDVEPERVKRLLEAGADIDARSIGSHTRGMTALDVAVWYKWDLKAVKLLVDSGADVNATDNAGNSALIYATRSRPAIHWELVDLLARAGADVNAGNDKGMTPLMYAAMHDDPKTLQLLLKAGADVSARDKAGWTALMHATRRKCGHPKIVAMLIASRADVNAVHKHGGTALASAAYNGHAEVVELLQEAGADVNAKDEAGWTPLICAAVNGHRRIVEMLIEAGARVRVEDKLGRTPLSVASENGHTETADVLLAAGATQGGASR